MGLSSYWMDALGVCRFTQSVYNCRWSSPWHPSVQPNKLRTSGNQVTRTALDLWKMGIVAPHGFQQLIKFPKLWKPGPPQPHDNFLSIIGLGAEVSTYTSTCWREAVASVSATFTKCLPFALHAIPWSCKYLVRASIVGASLDGGISIIEKANSTADHTRNNREAKAPPVSLFAESPYEELYSSCIATIFFARMYGAVGDQTREAIPNM